MKAGSRMLDGLKKMAEKAFTAGREDEIDRLLADPLLLLRRELVSAYFNKEFTASRFEDFTAQLAKLDDIKEQLEVAEAALAKREAPSELTIELNTPAKTTLWAAVLARLMDEMEEPVASSRIYRQIKDSIGIYNESIILSKVISASLQNDEVSFAFGQPGSWFYHDPIANHVNMDLYFSLVLGFEHTRAVGLHELGHSELSVVYAKTMRDIYERVKNHIDPRTIDDPSAPRQQLTEDEQKAVAMDVKEWELRRMLWHPTEDNCVNQYAANMEGIVKLGQSFAGSLNYMSVVLQNFWQLDPDRLPPKLTTEIPREPGEDDSAYEARQDEREQKIRRYREMVAFHHRPFDAGEIDAINRGDISLAAASKMMSCVANITLMAFYERNGLFRGTRETWERFKIFIDDINKTIDVSAIPAATGKTPFEYLYDLCAGDSGIHALQPQPADRFFGREHYRKKVAETSEARGAVVDHIWNVYLEKYADVIRHDFAKKVEDELNKQKPSGGNKQPQQGKGGEEGGKVSPGQQQGSGDDASGGSPKSDTGKTQDNGGNGSEGDPQDISDALKDAVKKMNETPQQAGKQEPHKEGKGQQKKKGGWSQDPQQDIQPQKVGDIKAQSPVNDNLTEEQKKAMRDAAGNIAEVPKDGMRSNAAGKGGMQLDLEALARGDWTDFQARVNELMPVITRLAEVYRKIKEEQRQEVIRLSPEHDLLPEDGDFRGRLDRAKYLDMKFRQATGQPMNIEDLKNFGADKVDTMESTIEIASMIDGSGSMAGWRINAAIQSAVINYMAARMAGIDSYIIVWGNPDPLVLAHPESDFRKVGEMLEELRKRANGGTDLAPGLDKAVSRMSEQKNPGFCVSGSSHVIIYSDGDIFDREKAAQRLGAIAESGRNISVDVAILRENQRPDLPTGTAMESMFLEIIREKGEKNLGVVRGCDPQEVPMEVARLMLKRVRSFPVATEPDAEKRRRLRQLHQKMTNRQF